MMTSSNGNIFHVTDWPFVRGISPVDSPHKGQWRGAFVFSLICAWINGWVKHRAAGDLRRHLAQYDVTVMQVVGICLPLGLYKGSGIGIWKTLEKIIPIGHMGPEFIAVEVFSNVYLNQPSKKKGAIPAKRRPCLTHNWYSYSHHA